MSSQSKILLVTVALLVSVGVIGAMQNDSSPKAETVESQRTEAAVADISKNVSKNEDSHLSELRRERKERRRKAMLKMMQLYAMKMNAENDHEKMAQLMIESQLPEEDQHRMEIRDTTIGQHIWTEGAAVFDSMIEEQTEDPEWTDDVAYTFSEYLNKDEFQGSDMKDMECYEIMCKGVFNHDDRDALVKFQDTAAFNTIDGPSRGFIKEQLDGSVEYTVYFARPGDDALLHEEMYDRLYERVTGQTVDEIALQQVDMNELN